MKQLAFSSWLLLVGVSFAQSSPPLVAGPDDPTVEEDVTIQEFNEPPQRAQQQFSPDDDYFASDNSSAESDGEVSARPENIRQVNSVDEFDQSLSPYGEWVQVNGVRVWRPSPSVVGTDFSPYATGGGWVWTPAGWSFESTYPFGWATFHYGRWWQDASYGWVWWPDTVWGPSWVDWRFGGGYAGWAPLAPSFWMRGTYRPNWYFVNSRDFYTRDAWRMRLYGNDFHRAWSASNPIHPRVYGSVQWRVGPGFHDVRRFAGAPPVYRGGVFNSPNRPFFNSPVGPGPRGGGFHPQGGSVFVRPSPGTMPPNVGFHRGGGSFSRPMPPSGGFQGGFHGGVQGNPGFRGGPPPGGGFRGGAPSAPPGGGFRGGMPSAPSGGGFRGGAPSGGGFHGGGHGGGGGRHR